MWEGERSIGGGKGSTEVEELLRMSIAPDYPQDNEAVVLKEACSPNRSTRGCSKKW